MTHSKSMVDLAADLGGTGTTIVWGSPKQRKLEGKEYKECFDLAVVFFKELGAYAESKGVIIAMEANAPEYGCDFCSSAFQSAELVTAVDCKGHAPAHNRSKATDKCGVQGSDCTWTLPACQWSRMTQSS